MTGTISPSDKRALQIMRLVTEQAEEMRRLAWRTDIENAPKDREYLVAMDDGHYHVARRAGMNKATLIIGGSFGFDRSEKIIGWADFHPFAAPISSTG